jgi:hypothetical protein
MSRLFPVVWCPGFMVLTLSVIRGLAFAALPWMLDLWSSHWTVSVEAGASRWIFSSAVTCAVVVLWFSKQSSSVYDGWSLCVSVDFHLLFLFADVVFQWFIYADITVTLDTPNLAIFVTDTPVKHAPTICPVSKQTSLPFSDSFAQTVAQHNHYCTDTSTAECKQME